MPHSFSADEPANTGATDHVAILVGLGWAFWIDGLHELSKNRQRRQTTNTAAIEGEKSQFFARHDQLLTIRQTISAVLFCPEASEISDGSDASIFGCAARFNLSAMDVPASMNGRRFQAPPAVGQPLPPACAAELSEDGEIFDSDNDLPSVRQILASPKRAIEVIDLTCDDDGDSESDNGNHTEVSCLRYTRTARHRVTLTSTSLDRPLPGHRPTLFPPHRPLCQTHSHIPPTAS
jgi:hypothetical protein